MSQFKTEMEVELRILGGSIGNVDWANQLTSRLRSYHFECPTNRQIFDTIDDLVKKDRTVNLDAIIEILGRGSVPTNRLIEVWSMGSSGFDISELIEYLDNSLKKRRLKSICSDFLKEGDQKEKTADELIHSIENRIFSLSQGLGSKTMISVKEALTTPKPMMKIIEERQENFRAGRTGYAGFPTHFLDLDKKIKGLTPGHFTIIGARPGVGKTTFCLNLIQQLCFKSYAKCLFFSLEMPTQEILEKLLAQSSEIELEKIKEGNLTGQEYQKILSISKHWESKTLIIDDQAGLAIDQIKARSIRAKRAHGINAIFIDYVQLVNSSVKEARHLQVADISRRCKEIAKELNVPVVGLAQLNREVEKREKKEPYISDLRESGSLEADADEIILLHRPDMYSEHDKAGLMQVIIAKNRFGETGNFYLDYKKKFGVLNNYSFKNPASHPIQSESPYDHEYFRN